MSSSLRKYNAIIVGVVCLSLGMGAIRGFAAIESWSTSANSNSSAIGTEGMSENAAPSSVNDSYREGLAQITRLARQAVLPTFSPEGGVVNAYYITPSLAPAAYVSGQVFRFKPTTTNTSPSTLRVGSLLPVTIKRISNTDLSAGDLAAGGLYTVVYDGTNFQLQNTAGSSASITSISTSQIDNGAVTLSKIASAATGSLITFASDQTPTLVTPGIIGQVLTSSGAAGQPRFQAITTASISRGTAASMLPGAQATIASAAHGLGGVPDLIDVAIINVTAECGFAPGQIVKIDSDTNSANFVGVTVVKSSTQVQILTGASFPHIADWPGGTDCTATANKWNVWATPFKFNLN